MSLYRLWNPLQKSDIFSACVHSLPILLREPSINVLGFSWGRRCSRCGRFAWSGLPSADRWKSSYKKLKNGQNKHTRCTSPSTVPRPQIIPPAGWIRPKVVLNDISEFGRRGKLQMFLLIPQCKRTIWKLVQLLEFRKPACNKTHELYLWPFFFLM